MTPSKAFTFVALLGSLAMAACPSPRMGGAPSGGDASPDGPIGGAGGARADAPVSQGNDGASACDNGTKEGNETCDPLSACPRACAPQGCQLRKLVNAGTCTAECVPDRQQSACLAGDGCCPPGCSGANDADCAASCGNNIKESGEHCDGNCPMSCPTQQCRKRTLLSAGTCRAECVDDGAVTECRSADGCCPAGCSNNDDSDCEPRCNNNVRESGELCDGNCPTSCPAQNCRNRRLDGAGTCQAQCVDAGPITCTGCDVCRDNRCASNCGTEERCQGTGCVPCGKQGQPCCDQACNPGLSCESNLCQPVCQGAMCKGSCVPLRGACWIAYIANTGGGCGTGFICDPDAASCIAPSELKRIFLDTNDLGELRQRCPALVRTAGQEICSSNQDLLRRRREGASISLTFFIELYNKDTGYWRLGEQQPDVPCP
jgi:hypothetical protein